MSKYLKTTDKHVAFFSVTPSRKFIGLFERAEVQNVLISYHYIRQDPAFTKTVLKKVRDWGGLFMTDSGLFTLLSDSNFNPDEFDWDSYIVEYTEWLKEHAEYIFMACNIDADAFVGHEQVVEWNEKYFKPLEKIMNIAYVAHKNIPRVSGMVMLKEYCKAHDIVAVSEEFAPEVSQIYQLAKMTKTSIHGLAWTKPTLLRDYPFLSVDSTSWVGYQKFGTTPVWDGTNFSQYDKDNKDVRKTLKKHCDRYGVSFKEFCSEKNADGSHNDDEGLTFSLCTWKEVLLDIKKRAQPKLAKTVGDLVRNKAVKFMPKSETGVVDKISSKLAKLGEVSDISENKMITYTETEDGSTVPTYVRRETAKVSIDDFDKLDSGGMYCSNCFIQDKCPKFQAQATCAFDFSPATAHADPATVLNRLIVAQTERVNRALLFEKMEGGTPNKMYSQELMVLAKLQSELTSLIIKANTGSIRINKSIQTDAYGNTQESTSIQHREPLNGGGGGNEGSSGLIAELLKNL